jgi:hypothetical protein
VSKKQGAARKRRKAAKAKRRRDTAPQGLLTSLAEVLNRCEQHGVKVRFRHGAAYSRYGVVLPPEGKSGWVARAFKAVPQSPPDDDPDDD